jgi:hypothetical protein
MELISKGEVRQYANPEAKVIKFVHHNSTNLNNKATFFTHDGKSLTALNKAAKRRANRALGKELERISNNEGFYLGRLFYAILVNDSVPYNTKQGTDYLLPKGMQVLIEVCKSGFRAYRTDGLVWYSLTALKQNRQSFRLLRNEFKMSNKPVVFSQIGKGMDRPIMDGKRGIFNFSMIK